MMTPPKAADFLGVAVRTLAKWRKQRIGPPYHTLGTRIIYDEEEVRAWVRSNPQLKPQPNQETNR